MYIDYMSKKALFICGSLNQTTMMHKIASQMVSFDHYFTPFYLEKGYELLRRLGLLRHTIAGGRHRKATLKYLRSNNLLIDNGGKKYDYDIVLTGTDLIVQSNIRNKRLVLVQEGITEPEDLSYTLMKILKLPRVIANTAATGLSNAYDLFCVASQGYKDYFVKKGVRPEKMVVTGIPNFDNFRESLKNNFPFHDYVLVATSSIRETGKFDDRIHFLEKARKIAAGRKILFKLHPNEKFARAVREIKSIFPEAIILKEGNINHLIGNCSVLITQVSSVVYNGIALGKEVYSYFNIDELRRLAPIQNNGTSAATIAQYCEKLATIPLAELRPSLARPKLVPERF